MKRTLTRVLLAAATAVLVISPVAALDVDWFGGLRLSAGDRSYLSITAAHFGSNHREADDLARHLKHPGEDLPVLLFLAAESGRSSRFILDLRLSGLSWWEIRARLGVAPERIVVALPQDPGPPYGKAWGHYRNHQKGPKAQRQVVLSDAEFSDWIGARVVSRAFDVEMAVVLRSRAGGHSLGDVVVRQEKNRAAAKGAARGEHPAAGKSTGKGNGRGKGAKGGH
ncbi:MAG: hypothetical protein O7C74_00345 [Acidobacteria bacterium]|nr:hypothetical protein [Acidobacteriota bacterium]